MEANMPIPSVNPGEDEQTYVSRCIRQLSHADPNRDPKQIQAICYSTFRRKETLHPDFERIFLTFVSHYGESGINKFEAFVKLNMLKVDKPYTPQAQFKESFSWVAPLIQSYKSDNEAKYYKVTCLTANISMNNNDYSDYAKMQQAAPSLTYRPVNINHNHDKWLPFPRTRIDFTKAEDMSVEGTLRVDNQDLWLQQKIDSGDIAQVSIEGRPEPSGMGEGYHFTGLALLERGVELPGDPLTEIQPLFLNESVGRSMCKLIDGQIVCGNCETNLKESEKQKMSEQTELPATGKCVCPMCGQVDALTQKDCSLQKCSRDSCGHQMQVQTDRAGKKEYTPNVLADAPAKVDNGPPDPNVKPSTIPDVGIIDSNFGVGNLTEIARLKADMAEKQATWTHKEMNYEIEIKNQRENIALVNDKNATLLRENQKIPALEEQRKAMENRLIAIADTNEKLKGKNEAYARQIGDLEKDRNKAEEKATRLNEKASEQDAELEKLRRELNKESQQRASSEQKALNETQERSRIQLENADLRNEVAKVMRELSGLTEKRAEDAKKIYEAEHEKKALVTKIAEKETEIGRMQQKVQKALKFQSWAWKQLRGAGVAVVESAETAES